ncbi:MAG: thioesterase family protein [Saprospiraceae bacterium]
MLIYEYKKRVRYGETDKMGYLYYGQYPLLYEIGRAETMRFVGFTYQKMEDTYQIMMPVVELEARYLKPARYDEELAIVTIMEELPTKMVQFKHEIFNEQRVLLHKASVKLFFIDMQSGARVSCPDDLTVILAKWFS